ncbi:MAG: alpha/beta hydrolase [Marinibacterium sp.]|nr:alpha/beta hydrolase [Marinibacterium sp.]
MPVEQIRIPSQDHMLAGRLFLPEGAPTACLVLHGATGVPQGMYRHFAAWLAQEQGFACLTYDYRDFGASATGPARASAVTMADWGFVDQPAARRALRARFADLPLWVMGHSLGALTLPFQDDLDDIARVVTVASGMVDVREHPWPYQIMARSFWFGHGAAMTSIAGYLPKAAGLGADLPAPLFRQWRLWCTSKGFYYDDPALDLPDTVWPDHVPVDLFGFADDVMCPFPAVERLSRIYGPRASLYRVDPGAQGSIGHVSVFQRKNAHRWPMLIAGDAGAQAAAG